MSNLVEVMDNANETNAEVLEYYHERINNDNKYVKEFHKFVVIE